VVDEAGEMAKQYDFAGVEEPLYKWWESQGFFKPIDEVGREGGEGGVERDYLPLLIQK